MREKSDFRESAAVPAIAEAAPHYHGHRKRLRARFRQAGAQGLAEYELLELVLFRAMPRREVVKRALEVSASALILVHNHPSGDPSPSRADVEMTQAVVEAARALGIRLHDHIIVGRQGHASFKALGLI